MNLKSIAMTKTAGYRTTKTQVPEWDNINVMVREPMHVHFSRYARAIQNSIEDATLSETDKDNLSIKAEVKLFSTILLDEDGNQVFNDVDLDELFDCYGPVHSRLLNNAVALMGLGKEPLKAAEKK